MTTNTTVPYPMLAREYTIDQLILPVFIQEKVNGVRCMIAPNGECYSRSRMIFPWLTGRFGAPGVWLDGELYAPGASLQRIVGWANSLEAPEDCNIQYHAFDVIVKDAPQQERLDMLSALWHQHQWPLVHVIPANKTADISVVNDDYYSRTSDPSFEGLIYRAAYRTYTGGRTWNVMKRKRLKSQEYLCIGVVEGLGKFTGMLGAFTLQHEDGRRTFNCGGGALDVTLRRHYWANPPIGQWLTVEFPEKSTAGMPLRNQFVCVRPRNI